ncbi:DUF1934 domain-containing protein [Mesobacillus harenae]|uniref:DUF1934 domain-containing protein n=1 Tax=Mesobacillus harenae TaxID=2213203 RepID=UPI0015810B8F|nr:DUF1934 domain-containing protein [Mesobacillus harenae]
MVRPAEQTNVKVDVKTIIHSEGHQEKIDLTTSGQFYKKETSSYLQYDEPIEEGKIHTTVKMMDSELRIMRSGSVKMRLPFRLHKKLRGTYETPMGQLLTETVTKRLEITYNEEKTEGVVDVLYELAVQGSAAGTYHLTITFKEEGK